MTQVIQAAVKVADRIVIELDNSIVKMANVKSGELFSQVLTKEGILLIRRESGGGN